MSADATAIILAAGEGTRMQSNRPKVVHEVANRAMILHVVAACRAAGFGSVACVVGAKADVVRACVAAFDRGVSFHEQVERSGTANAVLAAREVIAAAKGPIVVLNGDGPLIRADTLEALVGRVGEGHDLEVLGFETDDPFGYGRMIRDGDRLDRIVEEKDASDEERRETLCNSGIMAFGSARALQWLDAIGNDNAKGEYYLTDIVAVAKADGATVVAGSVEEDETLGVNDRVQLSEVEAIWQRRRRDELMRAGVQMQDPTSVWLSADTVIDRNTVLEPNVWFGSGCAVGQGVRIRANSHLEGATLADGCEVGPFARLRPGTELAEKVKVGNFVETKNAKVAAGAKLNHLSYLGDARIGAAANIGAGTITCNYDGYLKHTTTIGEEAFIGSNTSLVAPVAVGARANVAAGSVIVEDVEADALAIARGRQVGKSGRARSLREGLAAQKAKLKA